MASDTINCPLCILMFVLVLIVSASVTVAFLLVLAVVVVRQYFCCCKSSLPGGGRYRQRASRRVNQPGRASSRLLLGDGKDRIIDLNDIKHSHQPPPMRFEVGHKYRTTVIVGDPNYALLTSSSSTPMMSDDRWIVCGTNNGQDTTATVIAQVIQSTAPNDKEHPTTAMSPETEGFSNVVNENVDDVTSFAAASCYVNVERDDLPVAPDIADFAEFGRKSTKTTEELTAAVGSTHPVRFEQDGPVQGLDQHETPRVVRTNQPEVGHNAGTNKASEEIEAPVAKKVSSDIITVSDIRAIFATSAAGASNESDAIVKPRKPRFEVKSLDYAAKPVKH